MMMAIGLLAILFLVGILKTLFSVPNSKQLAYILSFLPNRSSTVTTNSTTIQGPNKEKEKENHNNIKAKVKQVFATFDKNGDGFITKKELGESLRSIGLFSSEKEVGSMFERLDSNGDGLIDVDEFREMYESLGRSSKGVVEDQLDGEEEGELREAFAVFDGDGDGLINLEELGSVLLSLGLKQGIRIEDCKEMIRKVDKDGDGMVNFDEFKEMMKAAEIGVISSSS